MYSENMLIPQKRGVWIRFNRQKLQVVLWVELCVPQRHFGMLTPGIRVTLLRSRVIADVMK
jgi:hypothetical protein